MTGHKALTLPADVRAAIDKGQDFPGRSVYVELARTNKAPILPQALHQSHDRKLLALFAGYYHHVRGCTAELDGDGAERILGEAFELVRERLRSTIFRSNRITEYVEGIGTAISTSLDASFRGNTAARIAAQDAIRDLWGTNAPHCLACVYAEEAKRMLMAAFIREVVNVRTEDDAARFLREFKSAQDRLIR